MNTIKESMIIIIFHFPILIIKIQVSNIKQIFDILYSINILKFILFSIMLLLIIILLIENISLVKFIMFNYKKNNYNKFKLFLIIK